MCLTADVKYKSVQNVILLATGIDQCPVGNLYITLLYYIMCPTLCHRLAAGLELLRYGGL